MVAAGATSWHRDLADLGVGSVPTLEIFTAPMKVGDWNLAPIDSWRPDICSPRKRETEGSLSYKVGD
ncbi:hypothetical protein V6N13_072430 [Hibiscus sabdariffa]